jgi:hypothetical protein
VKSEINAVWIYCTVTERNIANLHSITLLFIHSFIYSLFYSYFRLFLSSFLSCFFPSISVFPHTSLIKSWDSSVSIVTKSQAQRLGFNLRQLQWYSSVPARLDRFWVSPSLLCSCCRGGKSAGEWIWSLYLPLKSGVLIICDTMTPYNNTWIHRIPHFFRPAESVILHSFARLYQPLRWQKNLSSFTASLHLQQAVNYSCTVTNWFS